MILTRRLHTLKLRGIILFGEPNPRCVLIARSHALLKDHIAALALYEQAQTYLSKIAPSIASPTENDIPVSKGDISSLLTVIKTEMKRFHAHAILFHSPSHQSSFLQKVSDYFLSS